MSRNSEYRAWLGLGILCSLLTACGPEDEPVAGPPDDDAATTQAMQATDDRSAAPADPPPISELPRTDLAGLRRIIDDAAADDRVVVIDFWATWCAPCKAIFPTVHSGLTELGDAVVPISVTIDTPDAEAAAIEFLHEQHALEGAYILPDTAEQTAVLEGLGEDWDAWAPPVLLVYDQEGQLAGEYFARAAQPMAEAVVEHARRLVAEGPGAAAPELAR
jgi:thiol-disulfide isomerase/thioredoxin